MVISEFLTHHPVFTTVHSAKRAFSLASLWLCLYACFCLLINGYSWLVHFFGVAKVCQ